MKGLVVAKELTILILTRVICARNILPIPIMKEICNMNCWVEHWLVKLNTLFHHLFSGLPLRKILKKSAVPTLKLPGSKIIVKENSREERLEKRKRKVEVKNILTESSRHPQASTSRIRSDTPLSYDVSNEEKYKTLLAKYTILEKHFLQLKQTNRQKMKKTC